MAAIEEATGDARRKAEKLVDSLLTYGIDGFGPLNSASDSAEDALAKSPDAELAIRSLIRIHVALAGAQGFVTNLGGIITLPVALPANVGAVSLIQIHLIAAIAHVRGHDVHSETVRTAILLCLLGNSATQVLKKAGIEIGQKFALTMIKRVPIEILRRVNRRVGFMLIAKYGAKRSAITLTKLVPLVGGVVGLTVDAASTGAVGAFAKKFFTNAETDVVDRGDADDDSDGTAEPAIA